MLWFLFGITSALFDTSRISLTKRISQGALPHSHPYTTTLANFIYLLPVALAAFLILLSQEKLNSSQGTAYVSLLISAILYLTATVLTTKAAECCDLSTTVPFLAFAPLFITLSSTFLLGEIPNTIGLIGIALIAIGSYFIHFNWEDIKSKRWLASLSRLKDNRGAQYILAVALLFGLIGSLNRFTVVNLGVEQFLTLWISTLGILAFGLATYKETPQISHLISNWPRLLPINLSYLGMVSMDTLGLSLTMAPLIFAVKRSEILFSVLTGAFVFKEHNLGERLFGTTIMLVGLLTILWSAR